MPVLELPGISCCQDSASSTLMVLVGLSAQWSWSLTTSLLSILLHWRLLDATERNECCCKAPFKQRCLKIAIQILLLTKKGGYLGKYQLLMKFFRFSRKNQQWKCFLQEETKSSRVFVTKTFKVFCKRRNLRASMWMRASHSPLSTVPLRRGEFIGRGSKRLHEGEENITSSPVQQVMAGLKKKSRFMVFKKIHKTERRRTGHGKGSCSGMVMLVRVFLMIYHHC